MGEGLIIDTYLYIHTQTNRLSIFLSLILMRTPTFSLLSPMCHGWILVKSSTITGEHYCKLSFSLPLSPLFLLNIYQSTVARAPADLAATTTSLSLSSHVLSLSLTRRSWWPVGSSRTPPSLPFSLPFLIFILPLSLVTSFLLKKSRSVRICNILRISLIKALKQHLCPHHFILFIC